MIGFRDIARSTDVRTLIAGIVPSCAAGNTSTLLIPERSAGGYSQFAPLLLANLNSLIADYIARQKVQSTHVNSYILEQLPLLPATAFVQRIGERVIGNFVREQVLHLTYTAVDMAPFARDMGYAGRSFVWNQEDRRHRVARLDALFFYLYGLSREDADYVLEQFPIIRERDEAIFGRYRTKELVLAYMNAVAAGDLETIVDL